MNSYTAALVGGSWIGGTTMVDVLSPADQTRVVGKVPALNSADIDTAFAAARAGFRTWSRMSGLARGSVLARTAALLRERANEIVASLVAENGKTTAEATGEVGKAAEFFDFYSAIGRLPHGELLHDSRANTTVHVRHEAVGVVLAITPWNDPLLTPARKLAPALAAGNAVVLKPASETPLVALHLGRALMDAGLPPGVLSVITGRARDIADTLITNSEIDAVTFTGSTAVGLGLQRKLAGRNLRIQTEMGGKNAAIVLADADLDLAVETIAAAAFGQGGQRCTATSRVLVERSVQERLVDGLIAAARSVIVGDPQGSATTMGPLVSASHQAQVLENIAKAIEQGARVRVGGGKPAGEAFKSGCWVEPTVVDTVDETSVIWREELFGPVVAILPIDSLDEAIELANRSDYGLSASLFSTSLAAVSTFLDRIETGQASVNLPTSGWDVHHPFGGYKMSGSPFKEQGLEAMHFYTRVKTCAVRAGR